MCGIKLKFIDSILLQVMAELPPRKNATPVKLGSNNKLYISPLQVLLQMGFNKNRAEKALAATGYKNVQLASDWLLAHVNDSTLDCPLPREYLLYICPAGPLNQQLQNFWSQSASECGSNGAHEFLPHITLVPPFKVSDDCVPSVVSVMERIVEREGLKMPAELKLERYISPNFMGFFLCEDSAAALKSMASQFCRELAGLNIKAEAQSQALHLTLAYNFPSAQFGILESLVKGIDAEDAASWQLRLFSRDTRLSGKKVFRVIYPHVPRESDELELLLGDFVYVEPETFNQSVDGWIEGISWLTGCSGFLPKNYIERTAESDAWTLHKAIELNASTVEEDELDGMTALTVQARLLLNQQILPSSTKSLDSLEGSLDVTDGNTRNNSTPVQRPLSSKQDHRRIFVVRHGERVDFTFGSWIPYCFDAEGKYVRKDLNMPISLPLRQGAPDSFYKDCPLTQVGETQALLLGQALCTAGVSLQHVYCSPSLRSLQTCRGILRGLLQEETTAIALEPGLFEWLAWYMDAMPQFMTPKEMTEAGFRLKDDHQFFVDFNELTDRRESAEQYYMRSHYVVQSVLRTTQHIGGDILLVGHASTLDACVRQLVGGSPRTAQELSRIVHRIPYCSCCVVQHQPKQQHLDCEPVQPDKQTDLITTEWKLIEPPVPPMTQSANLRFDWQILMS